MQGFVLNIRRVKSEDLIVTVLTEKKIKKLYRFYGVRHSAINLGFKIDFVAESVQNKNILRLKDLTHLGFGWMHETHRLSIWQNFLSLLSIHLQDTTEIDPFYYELLSNYADIFDQSNPKRLIVEAFAKVLKFEGMISHHKSCFLCHRSLKERVAIGKSLMIAHTECFRGAEFERAAAIELLEFARTIYFENSEIEKLYEIIQKGF